MGSIWKNNIMWLHLYLESLFISVKLAQLVQFVGSNLGQIQLINFSGDSEGLQQSHLLFPLTVKRFQRISFQSRSVGICTPL